MSTQTQSIQRIGRKLALLAGVATVALGLGASTALAQSIGVSPSEGLPATEATEVSVAGGGFQASAEYEVGLCSTETYGIFGIPACGEVAAVVADAEEEISTVITVEKTTENVHAGIMPPFNSGQPETFTCAGDTGAGDDECEITVTFHNGLSSEVVATAPVSFE